MKEYLDLVAKVLSEGDRRPTRTGTDTYGLFGEQIRIDLRRGFPLLTTKRVAYRAVFAELLWFLSGSTNTRDLDAKIWDEWAREDGDLGPIYGAQWRSWGGRGIDQIAGVIAGIKADPFGRRHVVSAWNVEDVPKMALPPCHALFQFYVSDLFGNRNNRVLSCHLYQRSADLALGVPFNIASYALLTHLVAADCGLGVGDLVVSYGDVHIYADHVDGLRLQLQREPRPLPTLRIARGVIRYPNEVEGIFGVQQGHLVVDGYDPHPAIAFKVAV